jgi:hypothetical protein
MQAHKMKLGKKSPKIDRRTLQLSKYLKAAQFPYVPAESHFPNAAPLGTLLNDVEGDCTIAAACHAGMIWSKTKGIIYTPTNDDAQTAYVAVTGSEGAAYVPSTGANDNGCAMLDVLKYWQRTGIGGRKITAYVQVDQTNWEMLKVASYFFGGLYVGLQLPIAAQNMNNTKLGWTPPPAGALTGDWAPGSWGGHCIWSAGIGAQHVDTITWGERIPMTLPFWEAYVDEVYAIISPDYISNPNVEIDGFNMSQLLQDVAEVTS